MDHKTCEQTRYKYVQRIFMTLCSARHFRYMGMNLYNEFSINTFYFYGVCVCVCVCVYIYKYMHATLYSVTSRKTVFLMHIIY